MKAEFLQNFKAGDAPLPKEAGDALKASKDQSADIKAALEGLKKDSGYLFEPEETPPPYAAELVRAGANANELIIPMLDMQGLGDYSRNSGYVDGDVTLTNETVKCNFDRGRIIDGPDAETTGTISSSHVEGFSYAFKPAYMGNSHLEGDQNNLIIGNTRTLHMEGSSYGCNICAGEGVHIEGNLHGVEVDASYGTHIEGYIRNAEIKYLSEGAHVEGSHYGVLSKISMNAASSCRGVHIGGKDVTFSENARGCDGMFIHGTKYGLLYEADDSQGAEIVMGSAPNTTVDRSIFILGCGYPDNKANALRVTNDEVFGGTYRSTGADYAELFEWADGNSGGEDRAGRFVTLEGDKIRLANADDGFILGVVSGDPSVVGDNHDDQWHGMYARDVFGRILFETLEHEEQIEEVPHPTKDNPENTRSRVIPAHIEIKPRFNPDYNPEEKYIPRSKRSEWDAVGMMGKLVVVDDGTCVVDGWCRVGEGSAAVKSEERTRFRVMRRIDGSHVQILVL